MSEIVYPDSYIIYKPNAKGTGGALQLSPGPGVIFLKIAKQLGSERQFDWKQAPTFAIQIADVTAILHGIAKELPQVELFHDAGKSQMTSDNSQKGFKITHSSEYNSYYWSIFRKVAGAQEEADKGHGCSVSPAEMIVIDTLLKYYLPYMLNWQHAKTIDDRNRLSTSPAASGTGGTSQAFPTSVPGNIEDVFPGAEVVTTNEPTAQPSGPDTRLIEILQLAKQKLGATDPNDAKAKAVAHTGLQLTGNNLDIILEKMKAA